MKDINIYIYNNTITEFFSTLSLLSYKILLQIYPISSENEIIVFGKSFRKLGHHKNN